MASKMREGKRWLIIDTDVGTDMDDTWAIAQALRIPDFEVKYILTAGPGDHEERARISRALLTAAGPPASDVPIGYGVDRVPKPDVRPTFLKGWAETWGQGTGTGAIEDGVGHLISIVEKAAVPVILVAIGPMGNLKAFIERRPDLIKKVDCVAMLGSVDRGYGQKMQATDPHAEYNVQCDVASSRAVLAAPWHSLYITPLDVSNKTFVQDAPYQRLLLKQDTLMKAVLSAFDWWIPRMQPQKQIPKWGLTSEDGGSKNNSGPLWDCVTMSLAQRVAGGPAACAPLNLEKIRLSITDDARTIRDSEGSEAFVAMSWADYELWQNYMVDVLTGGMNEIAFFAKRIKGRGLALDVDNTLSDTRVHWKAFRNEQFANDEGLDAKEFVAKYPNLDPPYWDEKRREDVRFWKDDGWPRPPSGIEQQKKLAKIIPPFPGAVKGVKDLLKITNAVAYITVRPAETVKETEVWLRQQGFPERPVLALPSDVPADVANAWKSRVLRVLRPKVSGIVDDSGAEFVEPTGDFGCGNIFVVGRSEPCPLPAVPCPTWSDVVAAVKLEKERKRLKKPKFITVDKVHPDHKGVNLFVKVAKTTPVQGVQDRSDVIVGDATGVLTLSAAGDQVSECAPGKILRIQNGRVIMVKGFIRLLVDKWGVVKPAPADHPVIEPNMSKDVSAVEYEQA